MLCHYVASGLIEEMITLRRVYERRSPEDGVSILVDRLWPRGLKKMDADLDEWMKDIAPSHELRRRFAHEPERWKEFRSAYLAELQSPPKAGLVETIARKALDTDVTLVYAAKDTERNNARVLEEAVSQAMARRR